MVILILMDFIGGASNCDNCAAGIQNFTVHFCDSQIIMRKQNKYDYSIYTATYKCLCPTFVCVDSLQVHDVPYDVILVTYAITPKHIP